MSAVCALNCLDCIFFFELEFAQKYLRFLWDFLTILCSKLQVAIIGRSNVGKSSLIKALFNDEQRVDVSRKPVSILFHIYCGNDHAANGRIRNRVQFHDR